MRLSNKSTFSLVCFIVLLAFAAMPAFAATLTGTWTQDRDDNGTDDDPGWRLTIGDLAGTEDPTVTYVNPANRAEPATDAVGFDAASADGTSEGNIAATVGTVIAVQVSVPGATPARTYQRVTLPAGGEGAALASTTLTLIPKLMKLTMPQYYVSFGNGKNEATVMFEFEAAVADANGAPSAPLHVSDVTLTPAGDFQVVSVSGTNQVLIRATYDAAASSVATVVSLDAVYAMPATTATDGQATVLWDDTPPTITADSVMVEAPPGFGIPTDNIWDSVFVLKFSVDDVATDTAGSGAGTPMVTGPSDKVDIGTVGLAPATDTVGIEYLVRITPKADRSTTPGQEITLMITPVDKAGNEGTVARQVVKLAEKIQPTTPPTAATIPTPALGSAMAGEMLTVTFSKDPGTVTATGYTITGTGTTRMITVPADKAAGSHSIMLTWTGPPSGSGTVTYTVTAAPMVDPTVTEFNIDANSFVVVTRHMTVGHVAALRAHNPDIVIHVWEDMPDLMEVFDTNAVTGGGALILEQAGDSSATGYVARDPGTVGISEVMWAIDESELGNAMNQRANQWIEIHNLNVDTTDDATPGTDDGSVMVKLSWKSGATAISTDSSINGDLSKPKLDVVTNVFNNRPGSTFWNLPGQNGNPDTGVNFASAARVPKRGAFSIDRRHENKGDKARDGLYTRWGGGGANGANQSTDGRQSGSWTASTTAYARFSNNLGVGLGSVIHDFLGTPGRVNTFSPERAQVKDARQDVPAKPIIVNEVANRDDVNNKYEWIELRNVSDGDVNVNNYQISILKGVDNDKPFIFLPNAGHVIPAGGVLLLVDSDPFGDPDHPLAVGWNVAKNAEDQVPGLAGIGISNTSKHGRYLVVKFGQHSDYAEGLPDDGNFILVVRSADNHEGDHGHGGKGRAELGTADVGRINDIAGYSSGLHKANFTNSVSSTNLWPLKSQGGPDDRNKLVANKVRRRQHVNTRDGRAGTGNTHNDRKVDQLAFRDVGYSGIGYKRQASNSAIHGGTPGYDNGAQKGNARDDNIGTMKLVISELMLNQGAENARTKLPQWIEIYNPSPHPVGIGGWSLVIENPRDPIRRLYFGNGTVKTILPNQTILIVSGSARDFGSDTLPASTVFPTTRVYNVYKHQKNDFDMTSRFDPIITDTTQFRITLIDGAALDLGNAAQKAVADDPTKSLRVGTQYFTISDDIGNLDGNSRTNDVAMWQYPDGMTEDGDRTSLIRIFDNGVPRAGVSMMESNVKPMGGTEGEGVARERGIDMKYSWVHAVDTEFADIFIRHTWYGSENDYGTPLNRTGQILPVELSFFRPTLADGKVTIRWTTESELDNAGFNILRSEERNGEFKQVNTELIQGAGTTGEKTTYSWVDATAKPGVVYYYQIEDVSFAGEHQVLAITKLKGLISATNKLTTTWGELKEVQ